MKLSKRFLASLLACTMMLSFAACGSSDDDAKDDGDEKDKTTAAADESKDGDASGDASEDAGEEIELPPAEDVFDFGTIAFTSKEFLTVQGESFQIGDNLEEVKPEDVDSEDIIKMAFFQEHAKEEGSEFLEYEHLISENGEFWSNVSHIEGSFYMSGVGDAKAEYLGYFQPFIQSGGLGGYKWWNGSDNLINLFFAEKFGANWADEGAEFNFGDILNVKWDIAEWGKEGCIKNDVNYFDAPPEKDDNGDEKGGGVQKFGMQGDNVDELNDHTVKLNWTDVKIYVYDLAAYQEFADKITEIRGEGPSANTEGKVIEVPRPE